MRLKICAAGVCIAIIAASAVAVAPVISPAQAAQKKRTVTHTKKRVVATRPSARIRVQPRSFLDPGTDVIPGDRKFTDYVTPPGQSPIGVLDNTPFAHRSPLPGPFDLPGRDNPWPWNWCVGC
jgi:hypothetical protein